MKTTILMSTVAIAASLFLASNAIAEKPLAPSSIEGAITVNTEEVIELIDELDDLVVIDSRKDKDFNAGHIEDSVHLINTNTNAETLAEVLATKDTPVMFYCNGERCGRAAKAVVHAVEAGYTKVYYFYRGMGEWKESGLPIEVSE